MTSVECFHNFSSEIGRDEGPFTTEDDAVTFKQVSAVRVVGQELLRPIPCL